MRHNHRWPWRRRRRGSVAAFYRVVLLLSSLGFYLLLTHFTANEVELNEVSQGGIWFHLFTETTHALRGFSTVLERARQGKTEQRVF